MAPDTGQRYTRFRDFYPFYLSEHADRTNRRIHFAGTSIALLIVVASVATARPLLLLAALVVGYTFAWVGHFKFEKNRPATFKYPFYSFLADWVMWKDVLIRRIPF